MTKDKKYPQWNKNNSYFNLKSFFFVSNQYRVTSAFLKYLTQKYAANMISGGINIIINNFCFSMDGLFEDDVDIYLLKNDNSQEQVRKHSFSLEKSNDNIHTYKTKMSSQANKGSIRGKYIEKFKKLAQNNEELSMNELEEGCSLRSLSKRERNRISAKQSRDRKKLYIQLMEYEQKKLQKELEEVGKQIEDTKTKISKFCSTNKTTVGFATRSQLQGKLERILSNNESSSTDQQISIVLDSICFRIGATGRERIQKQNQCYKQIINLSLPALHRYLMWAATEDKHIFHRQNNKVIQADQFPCPLSQKIQNIEQKQEDLKEVKAEIIRRKKQLIALIERLWQTKGKVENTIKGLQQQIDVIRQILSPSQAAKFILFASRNKYRKDLNFFEEDKEYKEEEQIAKLSKPTKRWKKETKIESQQP